MNGENIIKIFVADAHLIFLSGIRNYFKDSNEIEVVGEAETIKDLMEKLSKCSPDLLLTNHNLRFSDASEFLPEIKKDYPDLKILMHTMFCKKEGLLKYIDYIDGFLCKSASGDLLITAIRSVAKGKNYYVFS